MTESTSPTPEPMTNQDEQRIRELLDMHPALLQPEAIEMRRHLIDARDDVTAARAQLAAFVPPGALSAGEIPALCGICRELSCVPGLPGCVRCVKADIARLRAELGAYHAAAESTDLEGDVGDHLTPLADWQTKNGTAPEWLVDAVIGLIAPVKAERDRLTEQVNGDRLHTVIEAALIAYWCLERGKREPDRLDLANAWSHAAVLVDALRRAGLPTGREALHDAHGVGDAVASALSRLDGAEADQ